MADEQAPTERTEGGPDPLHPTPGAAPRVVVPRWIQLVALPLAVLGIWAVARAAGPVLLVFVVASVLALLLNPIVRLLQRGRVPRGVAIALVYLGLLGVLVGGAILLADPIGNQISSFRESVPSYIESANRGLDDFQRWLDDRGIDVQVSTGGESALSELERDFLSRSGDILGFTRDVAEKVIAGIFALVLVIVISIYMLVYARSIGNTVRRIMPPGSGSPEDDYPARVEHGVAGYVRGQLLFSLIMGTSAGIMLWILGAVGIFEDGRTYAVAFGVFFGVMELIPFIGPVLGAVPPVLVALFQDPLTAVWVVLAFVALQQLEGHVVAPNVFGRALRINPLLVIFALLFGGELYGVIGALVSLPVAAMLRETVVYLRDHVRFEPWPSAVGGVGLGLLGLAPAETCPDCGEPRVAGDRYCRRCGRAYEDAEPERERAREREAAEA